MWLYAFAWLLMRDVRGGPLGGAVVQPELTGDAVLALLGCGLAGGDSFHPVRRVQLDDAGLAVPLVLAAGRAITAGGSYPHPGSCRNG